MTNTRNAAETIALQSLAWLVGNEELLGVFMGTTGASQEDMLTAAHDPEFLGSMLDFILMDDNWVIECCDANKLPYEKLYEARQSLPGGGNVHWT
ncbi:DUF3572 domain-containing protein [Sulfitobacter donghicola]|uniref:DUF3572 domain-containing protein n=1 Tax=Sulfitobacter donghicola DSW-25 = KCTC 12864 = JCM 14565 TaxID=1300350 RepID=A0A073IHI7_9RHOB|nr:DUF3572 domain-containing protein [Sulfitobacter donghicola]KEJ89244.1 hypothetical protein DSW25_09445 [Sulfitobacter donghicola DSW-25 = KCTC 12864 = JCM 14565]KIN69039.1 DUF3572 domain containing protein [Sulfitobacter donghicola DSW-25 = KCTC 12864 = JCM 14565]